MIEIHPRNVILLGFVLVLFGFVAPLLMVIRVIQPSYVLSFLSYAASFVGLLLGLIGSASYVHRRKS
jgi:hypothetical protein